MLINSPRANGMGSCVSTLVDPQAAYYNPGALGIFFLDNSFGFTSPNRTDWAKYTPASSSIAWKNEAEPIKPLKQTLETWSVNYGFSKELNKNEWKKPVRFGFGAAYSSMRFDREPSSGNIKSVSLRQSVSAITISISTEYFLRFGFGYTKKINKGNFSTIYYESASEGSITSNTSTSLADDGGTGSHDLGFHFSLPIHSLFEDGIVLRRSSRNNWTLNLTLSAAHSRSNISNTSSSYDLSSKPSTDGWLNNPQTEDSSNSNLSNHDQYYYSPGSGTSRLGFSLETEIVTGSFSVVSLTVASETETVNNRYSRDSDSNKRGMEIGALETAFVRFGHIENYMSANIDISTFGFGIHPLKAFNFLIRSDLLDRIDLAVDFARWNAPGSNYDDTEFFKVSVALNLNQLSH